MNTWLFVHPYEATSPHDVHPCSRGAAGWAGRQWVAQGSLAALQWFGQAQMMAETKWPLDKRQMHGQEKHLKPQCFLTWTHRQGQDAGWEQGPQHSTPSAPQNLPAAHASQWPGHLQSKVRAHGHGSAQGCPVSQHNDRQHQYHGVSHFRKKFGCGYPHHPHTLREAGKLMNKAYKQHDLGNYAPTGIYYLETMSGIKLPGKVRFQSK